MYIQTNQPTGQPIRDPSRVHMELINFDEVCRADAAIVGFDPTVAGAISPYLNPDKMADLIARHHAKLASVERVDPRNVVTAGGYFENRNLMWKGSYLDEGSRYVHLGIDVNVPAGTPVKIPEAMSVILADDDKDQEGGWGPRVILLPLNQVTNFEFVVVYAHLQNVPELQPNQVIEAGASIGEVGAPPNNGNWWPHLHVQLVDKDYFFRLLNAGKLSELDGYGSMPASEDPKIRQKEVDEVARLMRRFPHPGRYVPRQWEIHQS